MGGEEAIMDSHVEVFVLADQRSEPTSRQKLTTFSGGLIGPSRLSGSCFNEHAHRPACAGRRRRYWPPARIHPGAGSILLSDRRAASIVVGR